MVVLVGSSEDDCDGPAEPGEDYCGDEYTDSNLLPALGLLLLVCARDHNYCLLLRDGPLLFVFLEQRRVRSRHEGCTLHLLHCGHGHCEACNRLVVRHAAVLRATRRPMVLLLAEQFRRCSHALREAGRYV